MGKHLFTIVVAVVIGLILLFYLFTFQVPSNQVALLHTFGKPSDSLTLPGLHLRWPWPVQKVRRYDNRLHIDETRLEEKSTLDQFQIIVSVCVGWRIKTGEGTGSEASEYVKRFNKTFVNADMPFESGWRALEKIVRDKMHNVIGRHNLSDLVAVRTEDLAYDAVEKEARLAIDEEALKQYGVEVVLLKVKRLELPRMVARNVYDRMKAERQRESELIRSGGEAKAKNIRDKADSEKQQIIHWARGEANRIRADAEAEAAEVFVKLRQYPEVTLYLSKIEALAEIAKNSTITFVLDPSVWPFDLLTSIPPAFELGKTEQPE